MTETESNEAPGQVIVLGHLRRALQVKLDDAMRDVYVGTAEQLVAAGLVATHQLPGQPGRGKTMVSLQLSGSRCSGESWKLPGSISIRVASKGRYIVTLTVSKSEQDRRKAISNAKHEAINQAAHEQRLREEAQGVAWKRFVDVMADMPKSPEEFRGQCAKSTQALLDVCLSSVVCSERSGGHRFTPEDESVIRWAATQFVATIERAKVTFSSELQCHQIEKITEKIAADSGVQTSALSPALPVRPTTVRPRLALVSSRTEALRVPATS